MTINGKVDRKALPEAVYVQDSEEYIAPQGKLENGIASPGKRFYDWRQVGRHSDFQLRWRLHPQHSSQCEASLTGGFKYQLGYL